LPLLFGRVEALRDRLHLDLELLVMDDNSQDGTAELIASRALPWVRLVVRTANRGLSPSVIDGLKLATKEILVVMDADLSHPPERIPDMIEALEQGNEFVIGSRYVPGASTDENWGLFRWINSKVATLMARPFTRLADPMSGFFALRKSLLDRADGLNPIGYKIGLELLVKCKVTKAVEVPIHFAQRQKGESKLTLKEQLRYVQHLRRLFTYRYPNWSYLLQFLVVGASGVVVNLLALTALLTLRIPVQAAVAGAIGISMLTNFVLNRRFTFSYARGSSVLGQFLSFSLSCSLGAVVNYGVTVSLLARAARLLPQLAALAGIIAGTGVNYLACRFWVFRVAKGGAPSPPAAEAVLDPGGRGLRGWLPALGSAALLTLFGALFLRHQCIWIDETTQLKGLTLSPVELVRWLGGQDRARFGVPPDRMPPLSYLVGMTWAGIFGLSEPSLRWLAVLLVAAATIVVARSSGRLGGLAGSTIGGLSFACSPNVLNAAVAIRAYPLFLLTSACSFYAFTRIIAEPRTYQAKWAGWLAFFLVASLYTHFFGLVLAVSLWGAALVAIRLQGGRVGPLLGGVFLTGILSLGLPPFLQSSLEMSSGQEAGGHGPGDVARYLYRFIGHPALGTSLAATVIAGASVAILLVLALCPRRSAAPTLYALAGALAVGVSITIGAGLSLKSFKAMQPTYSLWVLPGLSILISMAPLARWPRVGSLGVAVSSLFLAATGYACLVMDTHGTLFSNSPYGRLSPLVKPYLDTKTIVIHDGDQFAISYFPLYFGFGDRLQQFRSASPVPPRICPVTFGGGEGSPIPVAGLDVDRLIVVRSEWLSADDQRRELRGIRPGIPPGPLACVLLESPRWRLVESQQVAANAGAAIHIFERR
ncbi:MAG TPA: glycosyltransferase, partial [Planctomycetota bacterium]|nr:glycosyltransferase [Planctomycetota bacterium]